MRRTSRFVSSSHSFAAAGRLAVAFVAFAVSAPAQDAPKQDAPSSRTFSAPTELALGDAAPPLVVESWLKGGPVGAFVPGTTYVVECWATWCGPCVRAIPHLTELQRKYEGRAVILGINVWEDDAYDDATREKVTNFVAAQGDAMGYAVAYDGKAKGVDAAYMKSTRRGAVPSVFIVDPRGEVAYIGGQALMDSALEAVVSGATDARKAKESFALASRAKRIATQELEAEAAALLLRAMKLNRVAAFEAAPQVFGPYVRAADEEAAYAFAKEVVATYPDSKDVQLAAAQWIAAPAKEMKTRDLPWAVACGVAADRLADGRDVKVHEALAALYELKGDGAEAEARREKARSLKKRR